jgi:hypothetical protein
MIRQESRAAPLARASDRAARRRPPGRRVRARPGRGELATRNRSRLAAQEVRELRAELLRLKWRDGCLARYSLASRSKARGPSACAVAGKSERSTSTKRDRTRSE